MTLEERLLDLAMRELALTAKRLALQTELEEIQADCPHVERVVKDTGFFGRSYSTSCKLCRKDLGKPETPEELAQQKVLEDEHDQGFPRN